MASELPESTARSDALTKLRIVIAVTAATLLGWVFNIWVALPYAIPTELLGVDMYSPAEMQQRLAQSEQEIYWKNGLIYFVILGIAFGLAPQLMILGSGVGRVWSALGSGIASGVVLGALAFFATAGLRGWLNTGVELPMLGHAGESLAGDILVYALAGTLVTLPTSIAMLMLGVPDTVSKAAAVPLAAIVAGLLFPLAVSFLMPQQSTKAFPPVGPSMLAFWLALLAPLMILFMTTTGDRQRGKSSRDEVQTEA